MISILAYLALAFLGLRTMVILVNYLYSLKAFPEEVASDLDISILIPCRNEEKNIGHLLTCLLELEDSVREIIVCDDHSSDRSFEILTGFASTHQHIHCFKGAPLPEEYTGKNWACEQLAKAAHGEYMLFIDADLALEGSIIGSLVSKMNKKNLSLLSVFPKQQMLSIGEKATVPVMNWILLSLLPLPLVSLSRMKSFSAANGQFMLYRSKAYRNLEPHRSLKSSPVEDIASMKLFKRNKLRCATFTGDDRIRCRMYHSREEALTGFSKNVLHYFSCNPAWILFFVVFSTFGLFFIALWSLPWFLASLFAAAAGRILISLTSRQDPFHNLMLLFVQHVNFIFMLYLAYQQKYRGSLIWKDREITLP